MTLESKNVVVTGGAGAIGSRLVRRVLADGAAEVIVIDDLSSGYEWLLPQDERVRFVREGLSPDVYRALSTIAGSEVVSEP